MANDWAPEPWELYEDEAIRTPLAKKKDYFGRGMFPIYYDNFGGTFTCGWRVEKESLPRIVACVNACAGVPMGWLISLTKGEIKEFIMEHIINAEEATDGHDNIGPPAHDNFRWFPDPEDL